MLSGPPLPPRYERPKASIVHLMWEEGMNTKPQIYSNNKHASTPQAKNEKKANQMKTICTLEYREVENTHTKKNNITKNTYTEEHTYIRKTNTVLIINKKYIQMKENKYNLQKHTWLMNPWLISENKVVQLMYSPKSKVFNNRNWLRIYKYVQLVLTPL